jgi:hypothetical protein
MNQMTRSYVSGRFAEPDIRVSLEISTTHDRGREPVRLLLIGSREGVNSIIQTLHYLRFAEVLEWSHELPAPDQPLNLAPGDVMRVLTKRLLLR